MTNENLDKAVTTIKDLFENINNAEDAVLTSIYGKTYVEGAQQYIEDHDDYFFKTLVDIEFNRCSKFNDDDHSIINDKYNHDRKDAFLSGCVYGYLNKDNDTFLAVNDIEYENTADDFVIMYPFNDNDFGSGMEAAGIAYSEEFNKRYKHINYLMSNGIDVEKYIKKLKELEDVNIIKNIICSAYVSSGTNIKSNYEFLPINELLNTIKSEMEYLGIENKDNYVIGSENAIREILLDKYACDYMKEDCNDEMPLDKIDCNHEVLIIQVKNGICSSVII